MKLPTLPLALIALCALTVAACHHEYDVTTSAVLETATYYREKKLLPPGCTLTVALEDVSRMDAPATVLATSTVVITTTPPFEIQLKYDPASIDERMQYALRARIERDGTLLFINDTRIDPFGGPAGEPVKILVKNVKR